MGASLATTSRIAEVRAVLTGSQMRAARALLNWSAADLAERCGVSYNTIQRAERSDEMPNMQSRNLLAIKTALEQAGVEFIDGSYSGAGGPGARLRS